MPSMMNNQDFDRQVDQVRQTAQEAGISGSVYIDIDPASGFLRVKLKVQPPEQRANLATALGQCLEMMASALGLQINKQ